MLRNIIFVLVFCETTSVFGQQNFFSKEYTNSNASLEFGLGYVFKTHNENSLVRYQIASRNLLLNEKLGFSYTIEYPLDEGINPKSTANEMNDLFGLNCRISDNLSFQCGIGLASNVFGERGKRRAISLAYHPDDYPFTITTGYSESFGPSLTVSYRISFYKQATE